MKLWREVIYPSFLRTIESESYLNMEEAALERELADITKKAISRFKFPRISLEYDNGESGYYFINDITYNEIVVILAWMNVYWAEYYASQEEVLLKQYTDRDIREYSNSNLIRNLDNSLKNRTADAIRTEKDYYRTYNAKSTLGDM